jgi:hypothetical protein
MKNTVDSEVTRGTSKKIVSLLIRGDDVAVVHPRYLHVRGGHVVGFAVTQRETSPFAVTIAEFSKTQLRVVAEDSVS